jgi:hypothetical protein
MSRRRGALAGAWVVVLVLGACSAKSSGKASAQPGAPDRRGVDGGHEAENAPAAEEGVPAEAGEELPALDARIGDAWHELRELDDAQRKAAATDPGAAAARCERIRGLADEICTLSDRMCTLATEHPGEHRYATACARSQETCGSARKAVERCPAV